MSGRTKSGYAPDSAIDSQGKRLRWQCGCRKNGGLLVQLAKPTDPDIDELIDAARDVVRVYREPVGNLNRRTDFTIVVKRLVDLIESSGDTVCECGKPSKINNLTGRPIGCCQDCLPF